MERELACSLMRTDLNVDNLCFASVLTVEEFCLVRTTHIVGFSSCCNRTISPQVSNLEEASRTEST